MSTQGEDKGMPKVGEVDVVYIRCNPQEDTYIKHKNKYARLYTHNRYWSPTRGHQEILYSIQTVRKYMSRVRKIFVCAPQGHIIEGLDTETYGVEYVSNATILGEENCPNFNSHSLELFTYKIPGLSEFFLQFNDDFFVATYIGLDSFYNFDTHKIKYYYENILIASGSLSPTTREQVQSLTGDNYYFRPVHAPRMFCKNDVKKLVDQYKKAAIYTKQAKFRNENDMQLVYLYGYYLLAEKKGEFIFLKNVSQNLIFSSIKILRGKLWSEGIRSVLYQIWLQLIYKSRLYTDKIFSDQKIYSMIKIGNNYQQNKENIDYAFTHKVSFICLNDDYTTTDTETLSKIEVENYQYFYRELLQ